MVKISEIYHVLVTRYRENNSNKRLTKIFQTNKNQFWVLLIRYSYLSQNSFFKFKNLVVYLKMFALQNGNIFIQIWKIRLSSYIGVQAWLSCSDSYTLTRRLSHSQGLPRLPQTFSEFSVCPYVLPRCSFSRRYPAHHQ